MADLIKFKEQVIVRDRTTFIWPTTTNYQERLELSAHAPKFEYSMVELCQEEYDYDQL